MPAVLLLAATALAAATTSLAVPSIESVDDLYLAIEAGPNRQVGFLSEGNYESVREVLPDSVEPIYAEDTAHLEEQVKNGTLVAALISGVPHHEFHYFTSTLVSPRSMLLRRPADTLLEAIDAAIVRITGQVKKIAKRHPPFRVVAVHTCRPDPSAFPFPSLSVGSSSSRLSSIVSRGFLRVAALGPYDWKQDGDYSQNPPRGFWPDYLELLCAELGEVYNITCERQFYPTSQAVMDAIQDGEADVTEPYWTLDSMYNGRGRKWMFASSCVTMGYDSTFFVRRTPSIFDDQHLRSSVLTEPCPPAVACSCPSASIEAETRPEHSGAVRSSGLPCLDCFLVFNALWILGFLALRLGVDA